MPGEELVAEWTEFFRQGGFPNVVLVGSGMEGMVFRPDADDRVVKVWWRRTAEELEILSRFYSAFAGQLGSIRSPEIIEVKHVRGSLVSVERLLPGEPLAEWLSKEDVAAERRAIRATVATLRALSGIPDSPALRSIGVLDERGPLWTAQTWSGSIMNLIDRRLSRFGSQLHEDVSDLDRVVAAAADFLGTRDGVPLTLIHGDLCGFNILVSGTELLPAAVLDFGFLSSAGDPAFDASIAGAIFNMYGPHARAIDDEVTASLAVELGYPEPVLLAYRSVYGLLTSNAYSDDGSDGHYAWYVVMLNRSDIREALGL